MATTTNPGILSQLQRGDELVCVGIVARVENGGARITFDGDHVLTYVPATAFVSRTANPVPKAGSVCTHRQLAGRWVVLMVDGTEAFIRSEQPDGVGNYLRRAVGLNTLTVVG
jgi:hypothetical protein